MTANNMTDLELVKELTRIADTIKSAHHIKSVLMEAADRLENLYYEAKEE